MEEKKQYWKQMYPKGVATRETFGSFAKKVAISYDAESVDFMFRAMDADKNGQITFEEFLWYMAITAPSNPDAQIQMNELIDMCFLMYDENGDGYLTVDELQRTLNHVFRTRGYDVNDPTVKNNITQRIQKLVAACDSNHDNKLTKLEIKSACMKDPTIVDLL